MRYSVSQCRIVSRYAVKVIPFFVLSFRRSETVLCEQWSVTILFVKTSTGGVLVADWTMGDRKRPRKISHG